MKAPWLGLALVACQRTEPPPPTSEVPARPVPHVQLVGCAPAGERPRVARPATTTVRDHEEAGEAPVVPSGWFPYAVLAAPDETLAAPVARSAVAALTGKLADLDLCLTGKTGSVSIMLEVATTGALTPRVGGIGHRPTEQCIANLAKQLEVTPAARPVELECGLSAGSAGPFRIDVEGGYRVVRVTAEGVELEGVRHALGEGPMGAPAPRSNQTVLVIADPEIEATALARVLAWLADAPAILVAVRADGGPPVFVAMAPDRRAGTLDVPRVGLAISEQQLVACLADQRGTAPLLEPKRVDAMLAAALERCAGCDDTVEISLGPQHQAKQLVGATSAVRRAGRDPVLALTSRCP